MQILVPEMACCCDRCLKWCEWLWNCAAGKDWKNSEEHEEKAYIAFD